MASKFHFSMTLSHFFVLLLLLFSKNSSSNFTTSENKIVDVKWVTPQNNAPIIFEKIEWEIAMPAEVQLAVNNWISNDRNGTQLTPAINPFDPDALNLYAIVDYDLKEKHIQQPVFGFFYQEFDRITKDNNPGKEAGMDDPNKWYWQEKNTYGTFLIRWAAEAPGIHKVKVHVQVPSIGDWTSEDFNFKALSGDLKNSFVSTSQNKHYFQTADGKLFMPIGLNLIEASFACNCMEGAPTDMNCNTCYERGSADPCCGIDLNKKQRFGIQGTQVQEYSLAAAAYVKLEMILKELSKSGGNAFRTFFDPMTFDVEFEKMNNYYKRQYQAWEFDQMLDVCSDLNLRVELNMQYHYSICHHSFGYDRFDWDNEYNCIGCGVDSKTTGTNGWCYKSDCPEMKSPVDFLTSPCAQLNYKKKLRYIIARWGYSKNIFVMELMSEMNNIGGGSIWELNVDTDGDGQKDDVKEHPMEPNYYADPKTRVAVANWHHEMARYIKQDLKHTRHLIAADYTGQAPMDADLNRDNDCIDAEIGENCNPCQSPNFDFSWQSEFIDVIAFSNYSSSLNRWEKMSDHEYYKNSQSNGLMCGWNNPKDESDNEKYNSALGGYESLWKPVIHAENGLTACMDYDHTGFVKDMLTDVFGGHASSGMSWDEWSSTKYWSEMKPIYQFLNEKVLPIMDPGVGSCRPEHVYSINKSNNKKTQFAEAIYLNKTQEHVLAGFAMNRSWNFYTQGGGTCQSEDRKNDFRGTEEPLSRMTPVNWESDRIYLKNISAGKYKIEYFDAGSGQKVSEVVKKSSRGRLALEDYPTLGDGKNGAKPYCFFIASKL